jgi:5-carboxymethyl-2-hydroxymuconate isomerase
MPHITIEYSANLEADLAPMVLVEAIHKAALSVPAFEMAGLRTRASRREFFMVADGNPGHAFIAVTARIGPGRDQETRTAASQTLMAALYAAVEPIYQRRGLALSVEVTELDGLGMTRKNNLRDHLAATS